MKNNNFFVTFLFLLLAIPLMAKDINHKIQGVIVDEISYSKLPNVTIALLRSDSTLLSKQITTKDTTDGTFTGHFYFERVEKGNYILRISCVGYETTYKNVLIKSNQQKVYVLGKITIKKESHLLKELVVTGTKIKMVTHGDTLIYNADAFNLAEGSMLDALISRMPGAKLDKEGRISINGKFIESLLVNGRDFFSGNPKLALENLPAYTVNKIKVFNMSGNLTKLMGRKMGDDRYVMDVRLKKEYSVGWMANVDGGVGTKNRYTAKAFGLRFAPKSRIILFCNINNLNEKRHVDYQGDWQPEDMPSGLLATKNIGFSYATTSLDNSSRFITDNTFSHENCDNKTCTSTQTYLNGGDYYSKSSNNSVYKTINISSRNTFTLSIRKGFIDGNANIAYRNNKENSNNYSAVFDSNPGSRSAILDSVFSNSYYSFKSMTLNKLKYAKETSRKEFMADAMIDGCIRIINNMLRVGGSIKYNNTSNNTFSLYDLEYVKNKENRDFRNNYIHNPMRGLDLKIETGYDYTLRSITVSPYYNYNYRYTSNSNMLYRLDHWSGCDSIHYNLLPSTAEALNSLVNDSNSYHYTGHTNDHIVGLNFNYNFRSGYILVNIPIRWTNNNINYFRMNSYYLSKNNLYFEPTLFINYVNHKENSNTNVTLDLKFLSQTPDLTEMVPYKDDSDPLNIRLGNPYLKNIHTTDLTVTYSHNENKHQKSLSFNGHFFQTDNAIAYGFVFDKKSGVTKTSPVSVNGNWIVNGGVDYTRTLDRQNKLTLDNNLSEEYNHCVDMSGVSGVDESVKSIVRNNNIKEELKLSYHLNDKIDLGISAKGKYSHVTSDSKNFNTINAGDFSFGFSSVINLLWNFQFATDIAEFFYRGYNDKAMNTDELVWNTRLTKSFDKGKFIVKIDAFDILGNLKNRQYILNSQGRTESYTNVIPRYAMLSVSYKFNKNPPKKN